MLAALVFYYVNRFGSFLVWRYYLGEEDKQERAESYVEDFQKYVTENKLSINDTLRISSWNAGNYVDLIVYKDSNLIYAPEWFENFRETEVGETEDMTESGESETSDTLESGSEGESVIESGMEGASDSESASEEITDKSFYENWFSGDRGFEQYLTEEARKNYSSALSDALGGNGGNLYPVYFVDGTLIVAVVDFTDEALGNIVFAISVICALAVAAVIMICYFGRITNRIRALAKNVKIIEEGDLEHKISESGRDEIAELARDVGSMRDAIVENMTRERRAWEANTGLITAMSHDIRTPLTVLLGYLDLIEMQNTGEISGEYISACRDNALRLKTLSDDMFSYFLVFGNSDSKTALTRVDANELLSHVVSEYEILLSERGFKTETNCRIDSYYVNIDERYFRRVIDNIFSNIIKYADADEPVSLSAECDGERITVVCKNGVRTDKDIPESNGIGLKTCVKMMQEMGGALEHFEQNGSFTVMLTLPAEKKDDRTDS